jgi:hypothetical protein
MARFATEGRIWVSMYSCHMGLSEETKRTSFPVGSHQSQMSRYTTILFKTYKTNPTTRSGRMTGANKTITAASQNLRANDFLCGVCDIKPLSRGVPALAAPLSLAPKEVGYQGFATESMESSDGVDDPIGQFRACGLALRRFACDGHREATGERHNQERCVGGRCCYSWRERYGRAKCT